jgi:hypothetical protein
MRTLRSTRPIVPWSGIPTTTSPLDVNGDNPIYFFTRNRRSVFLPDEVVTRVTEELAPPPTRMTWVMHGSNEFLMLEEALMLADQFDTFEVVRFANADQIDEICTRIEDSHSFLIVVGVPDSELPSLCRAYQSDGSLNFVFCTKTSGHEGQEPRGVAEARAMPRVFVTGSMSLSNREAW